MVQSSTAVVFESPGALSLREVGLPECGPTDCLVEVHWSGISTGTERLLWDGRMPPFPGLAYPLVPGYESVGVVIAAGADACVKEGTSVFVPGSRGFTNVEGLFGGAARNLVVDSQRLIPIDSWLEQEGTLLALVATAIHAVDRFGPDTLPELIIGHGVLGRLVARIAVLRGATNLRVWEPQSARQSGGMGYSVVSPEEDDRRDYQSVCDVSGDSEILNKVLPRLQKNGQVVLAGFYHAPVSFDFPPAFMTEATLKIAAEWQPKDLVSAAQLLSSGRLSLADLITHRYAAQDAESAYRTAFSDPNCLKLILDWRSL